jgi:hypothetical protein
MMEPNGDPLVKSRNSYIVFLGSSSSSSSSSSSIRANLVEGLRSALGEVLPLFFIPVECCAVRNRWHHRCDLRDLSSNSQKMRARFSSKGHFDFSLLGVLIRRALWPFVLAYFALHFSSLNIPGTSAFHTLSLLLILSLLALSLIDTSTANKGIKKLPLRPEYLNNCTLYPSALSAF